MKKPETKSTVPGKGDILAAAPAVALLLNFLVALLVGIFAVGILLLNPIFGILTALLLLVGLICLPIARKLGASKRWQWILRGALASNLLIVVFFCVAYIALLTMW